MRITHLVIELRNKSEIRATVPLSAHQAITLIENAAKLEDNSAPEVES